MGYCGGVLWWRYWRRGIVTGGIVVGYWRRGIVTGGIVMGYWRRGIVTGVLWWGIGVGVL